MAGALLTDEEVFGGPPPALLTDAEVFGESDTDPPAVAPAEPFVPTQEMTPGPSLARRLGTPDTFRAVGATVGGVAALPAAVATGPLAPAVELGGMALGAAAGEAAYQSYDELLDLIEGTPDKDSLLKAFTRPLEAAADEITWSGGIMGVGPFIRGVGRVVLGLGGPETKEAIKAADKTGIPLGAVDVSPRKVVKGIAPVLGVFPFAGGPFRTLKANQREGALKAKDNLLNSLAPNVSLSQAGIDVTKAAAATYKSFSDIEAAKYLKFYELADNAPVKEIFPTTAIRESAWKMLHDLEEARPPLTSSTVDPKTGVAVANKLERPVDDPVAKYAVQLLELPEFLTGRQIRQIKFDIEDLFGEAGAKGFNTARLTQLAEAQETALQSLRADKLPPGEGQKLIDALSEANAFYKDMSDLFGGPTAQQFGRVDKKIFKPGASKAGGLNADELAQTVLNSRSPQAIADLRRIAGDENFQQISRKWMEDAFAKSTLSRSVGGQNVQVIDPDRLIDALGLGAKQSRASRESLTEMLKGSGVEIKDLEALASAMKAAGGVRIPEASTFVTRRIVLGGARAGVALAGLGTAPLQTIAGMLLVNRTAKVLSSPEALKAITGIVNPKTAADDRRVLYLRLLSEAAKWEGPEENAVTEGEPE